MIVFNECMTMFIFASNIWHSTAIQYIIQVYNNIHITNTNKHIYILRQYRTSMQSTMVRQNGINNINVLLIQSQSQQQHISSQQQQQYQWELPSHNIKYKSYGHTSPYHQAQSKHIKKSTNYNVSTNNMTNYINNNISRKSSNIIQIEQQPYHIQLQNKKATALWCIQEKQYIKQANVHEIYQQNCNKGDGDHYNIKCDKNKYEVQITQKYQNKQQCPKQQTVINQQQIITVNNIYEQGTNRCMSQLVAQQQEMIQKYFNKVSEGIGGKNNHMKPVTTSNQDQENMVTKQINRCDQTQNIHRNTDNSKIQQNQIVNNFDHYKNQTQRCKNNQLNYKNKGKLKKLRETQLKNKQIKTQKKQISIKNNSRRKTDKVDQINHSQVDLDALFNRNYFKDKKCQKDVCKSKYIIQKSKKTSLKTTQNLNGHQPPMINSKYTMKQLQIQNQKMKQQQNHAIALNSRYFHDNQTNQQTCTKQNQYKINTNSQTHQQIKSQNMNMLLNIQKYKQKPALIQNINQQSIIPHYIVNTRKMIKNFKTPAQKRAQQKAHSEMQTSKSSDKLKKYFDNLFKVQIKDKKQEIIQKKALKSGTKAVQKQIVLDNKDVILISDEESADKESADEESAKFSPIQDRGQLIKQADVSVDNLKNSEKQSNSQNVQKSLINENENSIINPYVQFNSGYLATPPN